MFPCYPRSVCGGADIFLGNTGGVAEQTADGLGECPGIPERHEHAHAALVVEEERLRVPLAPPLVVDVHEQRLARQLLPEVHIDGVGAAILEAILLVGRESVRRDPARHGHGVFVWARGRHRGDTYDGEWHRGAPQGHGVRTWAGGWRYEGEWNQDVMEGEGVFTYESGATYDV